MAGFLLGGGNTSWGKIGGGVVVGRVSWSEGYMLKNHIPELSIFSSRFRSLWASRVSYALYLLVLYGGFEIWGLWGFERRDLSVESWEWRREKGGGRRVRGVVDGKDKWGWDGGSGES
jgi:hypothetical protein